MSARTLDGVEFALFAPYNEDVSLIGSWDNWQPIPMSRGEDGRWRARVPLGDGDYTYKFRVKSKSYFMQSEIAEIADPRADRLTPETFEAACLTVRKGQRVIHAHDWKHDKEPLPANDALVIYELHVGDFTGGPGDEPNPGNSKGRFVDVIEKLDALSDLGINAIEFMPVNEFPGERSWGYNPRSLFAVENNYGTPDDFAHLVDECHARGIRVIMDAVFNHMEKDAPLTRIDYTYWFHKNAPHPAEWVYGPDFNFEFYDEKLDIWPARQEVLDACLHWIEHFHIDGIRFDATYLINNFDVLDWLHDHLHGVVKKKPFYTIAEQIPQNPAIAGPDGPLDSAWHENYYLQMNATILGAARHGRDPFNPDSVISVLDPRQDGFAGAFNVVNYLDNHDKDRILWELGAIANTFDEAAFRRVKLGAGLLLTAPGVPMIWMGQEFGEAAPRTLDWQRLDWSLLQNERNRNLLRYYARLIHLRRTTPALQSNTFEVCGVDHGRGLLAFKRWDGQGGLAVVVANLRDHHAGEFTFGWPENGPWREAIYDYKVDVHNYSLTDTLGESEVKIYLREA